MKDEHQRLGSPLVGKTKEEVLQIAKQKLGEMQQAAPQAAQLGSTLAHDSVGTYITAPDQPSQYLPPSSATYQIKLAPSGEQYVTDGNSFSRWVTDYFPKKVAAQEPPSPPFASACLPHASPMPSQLHDQLRNRLASTYLCAHDETSKLTDTVRLRMEDCGATVTAYVKTMLPHATLRVAGLRFCDHNGFRAGVLAGLLCFVSSKRFACQAAAADGTPTSRAIAHACHAQRFLAGWGSTRARAERADSGADWPCAWGAWRPSGPAWAAGRGAWWAAPADGDAPARSPRRATHAAGRHAGWAASRAARSACSASSCVPPAQQDHAACAACGTRYV